MDSADREKLWNAITEQFKHFPALTLAVSPPTLLAKAKEITDHVQGLRLSDQINIARQMVWIYATNVLQLSHAKDQVPEQSVTPDQPVANSPEIKKQRVLDKAQRKQKEEQEAAERTRIAEVAKVELDQMIAKLMEEGDSMSVAQREALKYFKFIYVDNRRDPEISYLFPNTSRDQRYQWKTRAIRMIAPRVSDEAKKYISERSKTKFAMDNLMRAADVYLKACLKG